MRADWLPWWIGHHGDQSWDATAKTLTLGLRLPIFTDFGFAKHVSISEAMNPWNSCECHPIGYPQINFPSSMPILRNPYCAFLPPNSMTNMGPFVNYSNQNMAPRLPQVCVPSPNLGCTPPNVLLRKSLYNDHPVMSNELHMSVDKCKYVFLGLILPC